MLWLLPDRTGSTCHHPCFFCDSGKQTEGFLQARQACYQLSYIIRLLRFLRFLLPPQLFSPTCPQWSCLNYLQISDLSLILQVNALYTPTHQLMDLPNLPTYPSTAPKPAPFHSCQASSPPPCSGGFLLLSPSVWDNPVHSCALILTRRVGSRGGDTQMLRFVPAFKGSICYVCGTICCSLWHGKDTAGLRSGVTGHTHPDVCSIVTRAYIITLIQDFIFSRGMVLLNSQKGSSLVDFRFSAKRKKGLLLFLCF